MIMSTTDSDGEPRITRDLFAFRISELFSECGGRSRKSSRTFASMVAKVHGFPKILFRLFLVWECIFKYFSGVNFCFLLHAFDLAEVSTCVVLVFAALVMLSGSSQTPSSAMEPTDSTSSSPMSHSAVGLGLSLSPASASNRTQIRFDLHMDLILLRQSTSRSSSSMSTQS